jgi:3-hydroxyisobutyrate dehydrogenase-like beta-hydroxyacid dehydrogenase
VDTTPIGVVGVGAMGSHVAGHLTRAGRAVRIVDTDEVRAEQVARETSAVVSTATDLADQCPTVFLIVDNDAAVRAAGEELFAAPSALRRVIICSSVAPGTVNAVAARGAPLGIGVIDAAMVGGIRGVAAGTVTLFVGGDERVLDEARPDMAPWTETIHHVGPLGAGQVAKSANNLIHWAQVCAIDEALRIVSAAGLSVPDVRRALAAGPADSRALHEIEQMKFTWWRKDLVGFRDLAGRVGSPHRVSDMCAELMPAITVDSIAGLLGRT